MTHFVHTSITVGYFAELGYLKGEFANLSLTYLILSDVINHFFPEILRVTECSKRVQHVSNTCWIRFEHFLNVIISGGK